MPDGRSFPPGAGWWQAGLAVGALLLVAGVAAAPRFETKVVGSVEGAGPGGVVTSNGPSTGPSGPAQQVVVDPRTGKRTTTTTTVAGPGAIDCAHGRNGGDTAPGVSATKITVASTVVTSGVGADFLGDAADGMRAAFAASNAAGGICGRRIELKTVNSGWNATTGANDIQGFIHSGNVFSLVGEPDSEGLGASIDSGDIDRARIPVVGTDGMLANQYHSQWVWPVAASSVSSMHVAADWAIDVAHGAKFGIVFDRDYRFGPEGAKAFAEELRRRGHGIDGYGGSSPCSKAYCGISSTSGHYDTEVATFNSACNDTCDVVVMLVEPSPMVAWMQAERNNDRPWFKTLVGGEPLFDDGLGHQCEECGKAKLVVWTGYRAAIQPFDAERPVAAYCQQLHAQNPSADCHNEFTEGAYLGARMFVDAVKRVGDLGLPLTRDNLKNVLDTTTFDLGLTYRPIHYPGIPRIANACLTPFQANYSGSFNGWSYLQDSGWTCDKNPAKELASA
jgi:ABC-type branched-subunit amino acid transport system substrate-binding protein